MLLLLAMFIRPYMFFAEVTCYSFFLTVICPLVAMDANFLFSVFIFLASACLVVPLASRFKLGSVLGYLVVGLLIGPYGFALIHNPERVMSFAEFGVVMMLFIIGLELEPSKLWRLRHAILGLGSLQVLLSILVITGILLYFNYRWQSSLAIGMALALSSTAMVLKMLEEKNLLRTFEGEFSFAVLLFQDIAVIPILIVLPLLAVNGDIEPLQHASPALSDLNKWQLALVDIAAIAAVILTGRYLSRHLFIMVAKTNLRELFTAFSLALVVGTALLMDIIGLSPALGAFVAGLVLANSEYKRTLESDIEPFKGLLLGLFFISVGMTMNIHLIRIKPVEIFSAVALLIVIKGIVLYLLGRLFKLTNLQALGFAMALAQGGEFAFVLFQYAQGYTVLSEERVRFFTLVVALSMSFAPLLMALYQRLIVPRFVSTIPPKAYDDIQSEHDIILAGYGRFGQTIGAFLNAQKIPHTILEKDPERIELLRKFGYQGYFGDASRLDLLKGAGAEKAKVLIIAIADIESSLEIVRMVRESFPDITIFARARNRRHAWELDKAGVHNFRREVFDASLAMAEDIMIHLGYKEELVRRRARMYARHDKKTLKESFRVFEQEPELISLAMQARQELELLLEESD